MARKHKPEEIIDELREAEIVLARGGMVADASGRIGVIEQVAVEIPASCATFTI